MGNCCVAANSKQLKKDAEIKPKRQMNRKSIMLAEENMGNTDREQGVRQTNINQNLMNDMSISDLKQIYVEFADGQPGNDQGGNFMAKDSDSNSIHK